MLKVGSYVSEGPDSLLEAKEEQEGLLLEQCSREDWGDPPERTEGLEEALQRLSEKDRIILGSLYFAQSSQRPLARQLGVSQAAVSQRLKAALRRLRWVWRDEGSLFSPNEVLGAFSALLGASSARVLSSVWETTSYSRSGVSQIEVETLMRDVRAWAAKRPELRRFAVGFDALFSENMGILNTWECSKSHNRLVARSVRARWARGSQGNGATAPKGPGAPAGL